MEGPSKKKGSIRHCMKVHKHLKSEMGKAAVMKRIRAADTEALKVLCKKHNREALEAKGKKKGRKLTVDSEDGESEPEFELDLWCF